MLKKDYPVWKCKLSLVVIFSVFFYGLSLAQGANITYTFSSVANCSNDSQVVFDVSVEDFTDVAQSSFTIVWDPTVLGFDFSDTSKGPRLFNLLSLTRDQFDFGPAGILVDGGKMILNYQRDSMLSTTVADGHRAFSIKFDVLDSTVESMISGDDSEVAVVTVYGTPGTPSGSADFVAGSLTSGSTTSPVLTGCPTQSIQGVAPVGSCEVAVDLPMLMATDNCDPSPVINQLAGLASGSMFPFGTTTVSFQASDIAGNLSTICSYDVVVTADSLLSVDACPADTTVYVGQGNCKAVGGWNLPAFSARCGGSVVSVMASHLPSDSLGLGQTQVVYEATGDDGSTVTCAFTVTVLDTMAPAILNCPTSFSVQADRDSCTAQVNWPAIVVEDNCTGPIQILSSVPNGAFLPIGDTSVLITVIDSSGNEATCSFTVTVVGDRVPVIDCPADIQYRSDGQFVSDPDAFVQSGFSAGCNGLFIDFSLPLAQTFCEPVAVTQVGGQASGTIYPLGFTQLLFEATSIDGNTTTCEVNIEILPEPVPEIYRVGPPACLGGEVELAIPLIRNATVSWTGPAGFSESGDTIRLSNLTELQAGEYYVETTSEGGCVQRDTFLLEIGTLPAPEITTNDFICANGSNDIVLQVIDSLGEDYSAWQWSGPNGFTSSEETPIIDSAAVNMSGVYTVQVTAANQCGIASASALINVALQPNDPVVSVDDPLPCTGQEITFTGTVYSASSVNYDWSVSPNTGVVFTPLNTTARFQASQAGSYEVCHTVSINGCTTAPVCLTIEVEGPPRLNLVGDTQLLCTDGTDQLSFEETGGQGVNFTWRAPTGAVIGNQASITIPNVSASNAGFYSLRVVSANGCRKDTVLNVVITDKPETPIIQLDVSRICLGDVATLSTSTLAGQGAYDWSASVANTQAGIPANSNRPSFQVIPTEVGLYTYFLSTRVNSCSSDLDSVQLEVVGAPTLAVSFDGQTACVGEADVIQLFANSSGTGTWNWSGPNGYTSFQQNPVLGNLQDSISGFYVLSSINSAGCEAIDSVEIQVTRGILPVETFFDGDLCRGSSIVLIAEDVPGASYQWTGPNNFSSNAQNPLIQSLTPGFSGDYTVVVTLANGCTSEPSEPVTLDVLGSPQVNDDNFSVDLGSAAVDMNVLANDVVDANSSVTIRVATTPNFGSATVNNDGSLSYLSAATYPQSDRLEYELCYQECPTLCEAALVNISIAYSKNSCITTTVLTPNGDGENDNFYISCLDDPTKNPSNSLMIYNEWGDEVYSASPYQNDWEGTYQGAALPDGTYYFRFKESATATELRGFITIYR